jgi:outer membrane biosynthesis protein TonB
VRQPRRSVGALQRGAVRVSYAAADAIVDQEIAVASWRDRLLGDRDRLGWWTLPVFVAVGLTGAVLAGALAVVYYGQQVDAIEEETRASRADLRNAVTDVEAAGEAALEAIESEVDAVREILGRELPFEDATTVGVVSLRAVARGSSSSNPPPASGESPSGAPATAAQESQPTEPEDEPTEPQGPSPDPQGPPAQDPEEEQPPPRTAPPRPQEERFASGFAVATDGTVTFFATTYALVEDPDAPGGVVASVDVITADGTVTGAVHSWDAGRDLALIRAEVRAVELLEWRPREEGLVVGERLVAVGVTPTLNTVQVSGSVAFWDVTLLVTDLTVVDFLRGAPIVDSEGLVVGVVSDDYRPFGAAAGERQSMVPVPLLCERMLRNCELLEVERDG